VAAKRFFLSDLFHLHENAVDLEFLIPKTFEFVQLLEKRTDSPQMFTAHLNKLESEKKCGALNVPCDGFPDAWVVLHRLDNKQRHLLYIQSKRRKNVGAKSTPGVGKDESIEVEHAKCKYLPDRHTFVFITDDKSRKDMDSALEPNEIAVTSDWHDSFYGKTMALRKMKCI